VDSALAAEPAAAPEVSRILRAPKIDPIGGWNFPGHDLAGQVEHAFRREWGGSYGGLAGHHLAWAIARSAGCVAILLLGVTAGLNRLGFRLKL
jgi:hypothetical protein